MRNISLNGESLTINPFESYIVIDALYLDDIKNELRNLDNSCSLSEIKEKVFPYTDTPFAEYRAPANLFKIEHIKKVRYDDVVIGDSSFFSVDTGLIAMIEKNTLLDFVKIYDYGELVNSDKFPINEIYWNSLIRDFQVSKTALILSPGVNSGYELDGGGTYRIV